MAGITVAPVKVLRPNKNVTIVRTKNRRAEKRSRQQHHMAIIVGRMGIGLSLSLGEGQQVFYDAVFLSEKPRYSMAKTAKVNGVPILSVGDMAKRL